MFIFFLTVLNSLYGNLIKVYLLSKEFNSHIWKKFKKKTGQKPALKKYASVHY